MSKNISISLVIIVLAALVIFVVDHPAWLADSNAFLKDFVGANLLNVLGVILAITLASAAQLHLEFNKAEERSNKRGFKASRDAVRSAAYLLIGLFCLSVFVLICKAAVSPAERGQAIANSLEILYYS